MQHYKAMLPFCWFLLLMKRAELRELDIVECSQKHADVKYRAISEEDFVISCDFPSENRNSIFNLSRSYDSQIQWFKALHNWKAIVPLRLENTKHRFQGNAFWFNPIRIQDSGTYICKIRRESPCIYIVIDVQTETRAGCSGNSTSKQDILIGNSARIDCPGKNCYSHLQQSTIKWYKNGKHQETNSRLKLQNNAIIFQSTYYQDGGNYTCDYTLFDHNTEWNMRTIVRVDMIVKDTTKHPTILDPIGTKTLEVVVGQPFELKCKVQFGFERKSSSSVQWYRENHKNKQLIQPKSWNPPKRLEDDTFVNVFKLGKVTEEDLSSYFICLAQNSIGNATGVYRLKRKREKTLHFLFTLCCVIIILLGLFLGSVLVYRHWIELILLYRNYLASDETFGDCKEFDAFVSYAKPDYPEASQTALIEEEFALELLPQVLEKKHGYKLCLTERDIVPGGTYTDDIVKAVQKSRRAIVILSPNYVNGPALFELEAAINTALEDKTIKVILIQFKPFEEPQSLPYKVKKTLRILPMIVWKTATCPTANKQFWKRLQYYMPVKHAKEVED